MATVTPANTTAPAPSLANPISTTVGAILGLVSCLFIVTVQPPFNVLFVIVVSEAVLIAGAVVEWVRYFRRYIDYQIERRVGPPGINPPP
jgi:hypothetical protein